MSAGLRLGSLRRGGAALLAASAWALACDSAINLGSDTRASTTGAGAGGEMTVSAAGAGLGGAGLGGGGSAAAGMTAGGSGGLLVSPPVDAAPPPCDPILEECPGEAAMDAESDADIDEEEEDDAGL